MIALPIYIRVDYTNVMSNKNKVYRSEIITNDEAIQMAGRLSPIGSASSDNNHSKRLVFFLILIFEKSSL